MNVQSPSAQESIRRWLAAGGDFIFAVVLCESDVRGGRTGRAAERLTARLRRARLSAAVGRRALADGRPGHGGGGSDG